MSAPRHYPANHFTQFANTASFKNNLKKTKEDSLSRTSVIIPAFNAEHSIGRTLSSIPEHPLIDVIVVNDGSTDKTEDVARVHPRCTRVVSIANSGVAVARNLGAAESSSEWLCFLDADDEFTPAWLTGLYPLTNRDLDFISGSIAIVDASSGHEVVASPESLGPAYRHLVGLLFPGSYMIQRNLFDAIGGFSIDILYGEHHEMGLRLASADVTLQTDSTSEIVVRKTHDRSPSVVRSYHRRRLQSARLQLVRHSSLLEHDRNLRANLSRVAAFSAASLGYYREASNYYFAAWKTRPSNFTDLLKAAVARIPFVRQYVWAP